MAKVYIITDERTEDHEIFGDKIIGVVCSDKKEAVKAVNLAMGQIINNNTIYATSTWCKNYQGNWAKSVHYCSCIDDTDYVSEFAIVEKEVI